MASDRLHLTVLVFMAVMASVCPGCALAVTPFQPMVNYQRQPALGVGPMLRFSWAVPSPPDGVDESVYTQKTYRIRIADAATNTSVWDSGVVVSPTTINVEVNAIAAGLNPGHTYLWTVQSDGGATSTPAKFITALWNGFDSNAKWIWAADTNKSQYFANFRYVLSSDVVPSSKSIALASLFITGWVEPTMLSAYKIFIDGTIVSLGPGRGEANVIEHNDTFMHAPYNTVDITAFLKPNSVIAIEGMAPLFQSPCNLHACQDYNTNGGGVLAQIDITFDDNSKSTVVTNENGWTAMAADAYYNPTKPSVNVPGLSGQTAYAKILENTLADREVLNWKIEKTISPPWSAAVASHYQAEEELIARMGRPMQVWSPPAPKVTHTQCTGKTCVASYFLDYGREFQGGIVLHATGTAGTKIRFVSGELLLPDGQTDPTTGSRLDPTNTWGYEFNWTLRDGAQTITQHNYMIFRWVAVEVIEGVVPTNLTFSSWGVKYEYEPTDSHFISDNKILNEVHELARWTLDGGVVDTYTDSNTRERRPYECDGLIAATGRGLIQMDPMWGRHSHSWVIEVPTWPVEWMQMAPLLAMLDYQSTGVGDLFETYEDRLFDRTFIAQLDETGLINTSTGRHLVGWDPAPTKEMFVGNDHTSACNGWAIHGLEALACMANASDNSNATFYFSLAAKIKQAMLSEMWDSSAARFCDGICKDPKVNYHGGVTTNYFTIYFNLVPPQYREGVWKQLVDAGMTGIGDYGAFIFVNALSMVAGDDGSALLHTLTKCDNFSWCNEIQEFNATMTTESLGQPHQTMSHGWGVGALPAVVHGIMGIEQTSPAWASFTVKPRLASLKFANITVPTLRGPISVSATPKSLSVTVPCGAVAKLCLQTDQKDAMNSKSGMLSLDGKLVASHHEESFTCVSDNLGCRAGPRMLSY